ncbi:MAG TPA: hypothetical protein VKA85_12695 [Candidatus Limnocylindrales bacterium]|nr:hypothetical protein [Candidatus Limnocylindrales bacterium]
MSGRRGDAPSIAERLVPEAFEGANHSPDVSAFIRGLTTGALVGAAIAGSALWTRYRRRHEGSQRAETGDAVEADAPVE